MDRDKVWRSLVGGLGLFCVFVAVSTVLGVIQSHPGVQGDLVFAALSAG